MRARRQTEVTVEDEEPESWANDGWPFDGPFPPYSLPAGETETDLKTEVEPVLLPRCD